MLLKRIIPCLDTAGGRVVKGTHFQQLRDQGDPVALARAYSEDGADELTFLDIDATPQGRATLVDLVERTAYEVFIPLTVGGGIREVDDVQIPVIASGGAGHPKDLEAVLTVGRADAALAASIFHSGAFPIPQVKAYLAGQGIPVRI